MKRLDRIHLITGLIGSGKTLRAIAYIRSEIAAGRKVYATNIKDLNYPGVIPFDDPRKWQELPPGSVLVVDEAQRYWRARRTAEVPPELQAMETSRHDAVSFLLLTQQPTYLDKHLRGLVTHHEHLYRRMGLNAAQVYTWERCVEEPQSPTEKEGAEETLWTYPKELFGSYKSADEHTVKARLGARGKAIIAAFAMVAVLAWWIVDGIASETDKTAAPAAAAEAGLPAQPETRLARPDRVPMSAEEYAAQMIPRIETAPWSAPIFDGKRAQSEPRLFCMESGAGQDANGEHASGGVTCVTEQGTPYALSDEAGRMLARNGEVYNPYRRPTQQRPAQAQERPSAGVGAAHGDAFTAALTGAPQIGAYGDIGIQANPGSAPR
jgi:zona occludens toxin